jgi:hypothetical protein
MLVEQEIQHKDLRGVQVILHQVLQDQLDQQVLVVIKGLLHRKVQKVLKVLREPRVIKVHKVVHQKDQKDLKEVHHKVILVDLVTKEPKEVQVTLHKDPQVRQDLVVLVETKDLQETQEPKGLKDRLHRQVQ